jgi:dTMP kinase
LTQGRFITLEGGEGAGKSTQARLLEDRLAAAGIPVVRTRELGGTPEAEAIRSLFLADTEVNWLPLSEAFLANTARHEHLERLIKPALTEGRWVVCDRFADSTQVYQGLAQVPRSTLDTLEKIALGDTRPDLTILFDLDPEIGFARMEDSRRVQDRFETLGIDYHRRVRESYRALALAEPSRFFVVDASQSPETVTNAIAAKISKRFGVSI